MKLLSMNYKVLYGVFLKFHLGHLKTLWTTCISLIQKEKKSYFNNLKLRDVRDNKTFWRNVKRLFSEKVNLQTKITLVEKGNALSDSENSLEVEKAVSLDKKFAKTLNDF